MNASIKTIMQKIKPFYIIKLLSSFFAQLVSLFLVYLLSPNEYGHLALIISVAQLMFIMTSGWSNGAVINLGSKSYAESGTYKNIVSYRTIIVLFSFLVISLLFILLKIPISNFILKRENFTLVYILFLGYLLYDFSSQLLYPGNKDLIQSLSELMATFSLLLLTFLYVRSIKDYVYIYFAIYLLFALLVITLFIHYYGHKKIGWNREDFFYVLKYSFWQILSVVGIYVTNIGINYVLVFYKISVGDIGLYNFAYRLFTGFTPFFALFGIIIPKWIYNTDKNKLHTLLMRRFFYSICILSTFYLCVALTLKPFLIFVGKEDYLQSAKYFIYLFPAFLFMCYSNLMNTVIMNTLYFKQAQFAIIFQGISLLVCSFSLIYFWGMIGAIGATIFSFAIGAIYLHFLYKRYLKKDFGYSGSTDMRNFNKRMKI